MALRNVTKSRLPVNRRHLLHASDSRQDALVRLYERRTAIDNLIRALEQYQVEQAEAPADAKLSAGETS